MKILCLERDSVTQLSAPDYHGNRYTASFELFPFHEGSSFSQFTGIINGNGPLRGNFCVVRALLDKEAEARDWVHVMRRAREARRVANEFNKHLGYVAITVQVPFLAQIETVSDFTCLFRLLKPHDKRLKPEEFVTFEPFLEGHFQKFDFHFDNSIAAKYYSNYIAEEEAISPCCGRDAFSSNHTIPEVSTKIAEAFSHFSWHLSRQNLVCGLQGISNGITYTITNPTVHSTNCQFGDTDGSTRAIAEFFSVHSCNNICCEWDTCFHSGPSHDEGGFRQQLEYVPELRRHKPKESLFLGYENCLGTLL